jgi:hypothetical protein
MKTNLLKLAAGLCFAFVAVNSANAQVITLAQDNFDYPVGVISGQNGGQGWSGPWSASNADNTTPGNPAHGQVVAGNLGANSTGKHLEISGGWSENRYRAFLAPFPNVAGTDFWMRFDYQLGGSKWQYGGMSFFNGTSENGNVGFDGNRLIATGSFWPDSTFTGTAPGVSGIVSVLDPHNYLLHVRFKGAVSSQMAIAVWADYSGTKVPLEDVAEPTYQYTAWTKSSGGITQVRMAGAQDVGAASYDGILITNKYTPSLTPLENAPAVSAAVKSNSSFYPNPVTGGEKLNVVADKESLKSVSIIDLSGKKVASQEVNGSKAEISTQDLAKGVYILEVVGSKTTSRNKVVIN